MDALCAYQGGFTALAWVGQTIFTKQYTNSPIDWFI